MATEFYGKELVLDLHNCNVNTFNRHELRRYFKTLCILIEMQRAKLVFWDETGVPEAERQTSPKTSGTSAVQFILTSNITIHTLNKLRNVYVNIFSCKNFDEIKARNFTKEFFEGHIVHWEVLNRV